MGGWTGLASSSSVVEWVNPVTRVSDPALARDRVLGKAMVIFWPPQRIGLVSDHQEAHLGQSPGPLPERVASAQH